MRHEDDREYDPHHGRRSRDWTGTGRGVPKTRKPGDHLRQTQAGLDVVTAANLGMKSAVFGIKDLGKIQTFAAEIADQYPSLNVLINNAGIMKRENLRDSSENLGDAEEIVATNLLGPIHLTAALLPLLKKQNSATVMMVSSGLAFVPLAITPTKRIYPLRLAAEGGRAKCEEMFQGLNRSVFSAASAG